jgi:hypothetical protein
LAETKVWFEQEMEVVEELLHVDVKEFHWKDKRGKDIESLPFKDLTNDELMDAEISPHLDGVKGSLSNDEINPKTQMFNIIVLYMRLLKGNPELLAQQFTIKKLRKWGSTRLGRLSTKVADEIRDHQKKPEPSPSPKADKLS